MAFRVLQVVGDGAAGGGTTVVLDLSERLAAHGVQVTVAGQAGSYALDQAIGRGLPVLPLDFSTRRQTFRIAQALRRHMLSVPGTVLHAHGARAGLPAALLPAALRAALIYTVHGFHYRHKPPGPRHLAKAAERLCIGRAAVTVFVSLNDEQSARDAGLLRAGAASRLIYNGAADAEPATAPPVFDIAFLGRLHHQKNPEILVRILDALRPMRPSLCVIGSGDHEARLRAQVEEGGFEDQVRFLGSQPHAEALRHLERSRVMLLPSRWEGLPMSVIEAMHRGIPVVASDVPGTDELVVQGRTGYLVPAGDAQGYADRLGQLFRDGALRAGMGARAVERARSRFSIRRQFEEHLALYEALYEDASANLRAAGDNALETAVPVTSVSGVGA